jgi:ubiquitin-conjugating enzyme E2 J2
MSIKRIHKEMKDLVNEPIPNCIVKPFEYDITKWRFLFKGENDTDYKGGLYMGSIELPKEYPFAPPKIKMLTPNGRLRSDGKSLCFSFSDWHPESWNPALGLRVIILGVISFFYEERNTNGAIKSTKEQRQRYANDTLNFNRNHKDYKELFTLNALERSLMPTRVIKIKRKTNK